MKIQLIYIILITIMLSTVALTEYIDLEPSAISVISPPENTDIDEWGLRLLLNFDLPDWMDTVIVSYSSIRVNIFFPNDGLDSLLTLAIFPVTTFWEPDRVNWEYPWHNLGGDYDSTFIQYYFLNTGVRENIELDVTPFVNAWLTGELNNNGLIISPQLSNSHGFRRLDEPRLIQGALILRVSYYSR